MYDRTKQTNGYSRKPFQGRLVKGESQGVKLMRGDTGENGKLGRPEIDQGEEGGWMIGRWFEWVGLCFLSFFCSKIG